VDIVPAWIIHHSRAAGSHIQLLVHMIRQRGALPVFRTHENALQGFRARARQAARGADRARRAENSGPGRFMTLLWRVAIALLWLGLTGCTQAFFHPQRGQAFTPETLGLAYEDVWVQSVDGVLIHGWFLPAKGRASGTVMFLHGNAKNVSAYLKNVQWLPSHGFNVFMLEYRGFGNSHGKPTLPGVLADVDAGFSALLSRRDVDRQRIVIYGQSLGGALAIYYVGHTAFRPYVRALVVESAFASYRTITTEKLASFWLTWPFQWMSWLTVDDDYSPLPVVEKIAPIPLLVIHGDQDPIVPVQHGWQLYEAAREPKELWIVPNGVHNDAMRQRGFRSRFVDYLNARLSDQIQ
jgi:hypothetical protein